MGKRINYSAINTDGINIDRKEIIEIAKNECSNMSLKGIIIKLKYSKLPWDQASLEGSATTLHRIIHCDKNNPSGDHTGEIKYSELLPIFKEKFLSTKKLTGTQPKEIHFNQEVISETHSDFYIYYYVSFEETIRKYITKFALIGFDIDKVKMEWKTGKIYYFENEKIHKIFELSRIHPKKANPNVLFFSAHFDMQVNFFTIKINNKRKDFRGILPLTYSVTETQSSFPCAGKGILEKTNKADYKSVIFDLFDNTKGIKSSIVNALYLNKYVLNELLFDNPVDFINPQTRLIKEFIGVWEGVYLRPDLAKMHRSSATEKGGLCKFALYIKETCECELHYAEEDLKMHFYNGFVEFPFADKSLMKISLEFLEDAKTYRMYAFLSVGSIGGSEPTYAGVISGWANISKVIYSSTIYMQHVLKIDENTLQADIYTAIKNLNPKRIPKTAANILLGNEELIETLRQLENGYLAMFSNCMPV